MGEEVWICLGARYIGGGGPVADSWGPTSHAEPAPSRVPAAGATAIFIQSTDEALCWRMDGGTGNDEAMMEEAGQSSSGEGAKGGKSASWHSPAHRSAGEGAAGGDGHSGASSSHSGRSTLPHDRCTTYVCKCGCFLSYENDKLHVDFVF